MTPLHESDDVRAWIREVARALGLSQRDLARAIGISAAHLSNFLAGRRALSEADIDRLAELLSLSADERALLHDLLADDPEANDAWHAELRVRVAARRRQLRGQSAPPPATDDDAPSALDLRELVSSARDAWRAGRRQGIEVDLDGAGRDAWCGELCARGVAALERLSAEERQSELLIQGVPASLHEVVTRELDGLRCWIRERCDQRVTPGEPDAPVQLLLLRRWPLTAPLGHADGPPLAPAPPPALPDYRDTLRAWVAERPTRRTLGFIQRHLARHLPPGEAVARATIHAILKDRRHVALEHIDAWRELMGLRAGADALFRAQVELAHARSDERRQGRAREAAALGRFQGARWIPVERSAAPRWWVLSVLLDLAMHPAARADEAWIAGVMCPPIAPEEAARARDFLLEQGALEAGADGGLKRLGTTSQRSRDSGLKAPSVARLIEDLHQHADSVREDPRHAADHQATLLVQAVPASAARDVEREIQRVLAWLQGACDHAVTAGEPPERIWAIHMMRFPAAP